MINSYYLIVQRDIDTFNWTEKGKNVSVTNEILLLYLASKMSKKDKVIFLSIIILFLAVKNQI